MLVNNLIQAVKVLLLKIIYRISKSGTFTYKIKDVYLFKDIHLSINNQQIFYYCHFRYFIIFLLKKILSIYMSIDTITTHLYNSIKKSGVVYIIYFIIWNYINLTILRPGLPSRLLTPWSEHCRIRTYERCGKCRTCNLWATELIYFWQKCIFCTSFINAL